MIRRILAEDAGVAGEDYWLAADKLIAGNPKQTAWVHYTDSSQKFSAGRWRSEPGKWRIAYTEEEFCQILEGRSVITDAVGNVVTLQQGDSFVVPAGFTGTWEVLQTTLKLFVIYEPGD